MIRIQWFILQKKKESEKNEPLEQKKKKKKWPWIASISVGILLLAILFFAFIFPAMMNARIVVIPDVSGEPYDEAVVALIEAGLEIGEKIETADEDIPEGHVIKTSPKAGQEVKKGSMINLYLSSGKEKIILSDYTGRQYDEVLHLLEEKGFKEIRQEEVHDATAAGTVIQQDPPPETAVIPSETVLMFTVSLGGEQISLKDLSGYNQKGLENYEESTGLYVGITKEEHSDSVEKGLVISQHPAPGTKLSKGDRVKVILSKGPKQIPPKEVIKEVTIPYEPAEDGESQEVKIFIEDMNNSMTVPAETFTINSTTKKQLKLKVEKGKKAGYKVIRDDTVILEEEVSYPGD